MSKNSAACLDPLAILKRVRQDVRDTDQDIDLLINDLMHLHATLRPAFDQWLTEGTIDEALCVNGHSIRSLMKRGTIENATQGFWWLNLLATEPVNGVAAMEALEAQRLFRDRVLDLPASLHPKPKH